LSGQASQPQAAPQAAPLSIAQIEARRSELQDVVGLSEEVRVAINEQFAKAIERLTEANSVASRLQTLRAESAGATEETKTLQAILSSQAEPPPSLPAESASLSADELRLLQQTSEATLKDRRAQLQTISAELERRAAKLGTLPELAAQTRQQFEDLTRQLSIPPEANEPPELTAAKRLRTQAAQQLRRIELEFLQQESRTYVETARLLSLRRDVADRSVRSAQRHAALVQRLVTDRERQHAEQQAVMARRAAATAHPLVHEAARTNSELADTNSKLVASREKMREEIAKAEALSDEYTAQYSETRKLAEASQFSQAIGLMLRSQQAELPDTEAYRERHRLRQKEYSVLNLRLIEWENERRKILDTDAIVERDILSISNGLGPIEKIDVGTELKAVFTARLNLYAELIGNARSQLTKLSELGAAEERLVRVVDEQATFISEHILWVRSTTPLTPSLLSPLSTAVADLISPQTWLGVWQFVKSDVKTHPIFELLFIFPAWAFFLRRRLRADLDSAATEAQRSSATGMSPTIQAIMLTAVLAIPLPSVMALCGWRLTSVAPVDEFAYAFGHALLIMSGVLFFVDFVRVTCQKNGLGEAHFGWDTGSTTAIARAMSLVRMTCLPASFVCLLAEQSNDQLMISTLGRLALIIETLSLATIVFELLRGNSCLIQAMMSKSEFSWAKQTYKLWASLLVLMPAALAFVSAIGFHYTATRLSSRMAATWGVLILLVGIRALTLRWLKVVYRRFALNRIRARRAAIQAREQAVSEGVDAPPVLDDSHELRLAEVNGQAQSLIRIVSTVIGAVLITVVWHEVLPALGYFNRFEFWENGLLPPNDQGLPRRVTLVDIFLGITCVTVTVLACRNLPGLLDISIFQRLPFDAGARYAASAMTQYVLVVVGVAICFRQIGIGWQSVQWLVAAMTVGLGFGLQEIFANFVSGIILLFERPIRVGDTVTIGNVSGTVTRIRTRATTVLDWDNKELIVPNRDFVTGNLVNWTLSNPDLRVVINIGIAHGSDTALATRLLYEVARANPLTLDDPETTVVFTRFSPSSLDFELRVFACGLANFRMLRHDLHMAIDNAFREHQIKIAFPQQDLHVRTIPEGWLPHIQPQTAMPSQAAQADMRHAETLSALAASIDAAASQKRVA
jgi:potassium efflux system protein